MTTTRTVGVRGATGIGLGAMLGAGVFAVWGPATAQAGSWLLVAVALAGSVAVINALSTAQVAAVHPVAGGAYSYGRREWHPVAGFVAGAGFVLGKTASIAAIALAIGVYAWPSQSSWVATGAIVAAWLINARGIARTAAVATGIAVVVLAVIGVALGAALVSHEPAVHVSVPPTDLRGILAAAALVFFAFAGYARIATLGEEVKAPERTIPRAIVLALALVLITYLTVAAVLLVVVGADALAGADRPFIALVDGTWIPAIVVGVTAAVAAFGSMVALMAGVGRTAMAMAREGDLPRLMAHQGANGVPWRAEGISAIVAIVVAWAGGLTFAIAMSSFAVLVYYLVANVSAHRARSVGHTPAWALWPGVSLLGAVLCALLALALPVAPVVVAVGALALAVILRTLAVLIRVRASDGMP